MQQYNYLSASMCREWFNASEICYINGHFGIIFQIEYYQVENEPIAVFYLN